MSEYTWERLARATLQRQFPTVRGTGRAAVVEVVRRVGPIQSQVARSPFVTVSSRLPGASYADINAAYEQFDLLRGSSLRGTVHTCVRDQHPLLDAVARRTLANQWRRSLKLERVGVEEARAAMEEFATGGWRTPDELRSHLAGWLAEHESEESAEAARTSGVGRAMAHLHSALVRRPLRGGWDRQSAPAYRLATDALGAEPSPWPADPDRALVELVRTHLAAFGPANRRDIAWWSGEGLRHVDAALESLADQLVEGTGPDGATYYDLTDVPADGLADPGVRLLPEYDAVMVGYDPKTRERFLDPRHLRLLWLTENGSFSPAVLCDSRLAASWKFVGSGALRRIEVRMLPGARRLTDSDLTEQVAALEHALDMQVVDVTIEAAP